MITFVELWKAKKEWLQLSTEERGAYMSALGPAIQQMTEAGVKIISWGANNSATTHKADYDYFAVWSFPDQQAAQAFENVVEGAGWYNYFDQVNAMGNTSTPEEVIGQLINL